jgi:GntR family transcriptional repressor for pyruvate dehydrogenase complex
LPVSSSEVLVAFEKVSRQRASYLLVADQLRAAVLDGRLEPGAVLPTERDLADEFGVSRTTIREALRSLEAQGFVEIGHLSPLRSTVGDRTRVLEHALAALVPGDLYSPADAIELQSFLEVSAAQRGALGSSPRWDDVALALDRMHDARAALPPDRHGPLDELQSAYTAFHAAIVASAENVLVNMTMRALQGVLRDVVGLALRHKQESPDADKGLDQLLLDHARILDSLRAGDATQAQERLRGHFVDFYIYSFSWPSPPPARTDAPAPGTRTTKTVAR